MNFSKPQEIAIKFHYFMTFMNEQLITNFQRGFSSTNDHDQNIIKFLSPRSQLIIFERALNMMRERDEEDEDPISSFDALKASLDIFFGGILTAEMFEVY